jgi:outer membrane lipoprotein-sorting protein
MKRFTLIVLSISLFSNFYVKAQIDKNPNTLLDAVSAKTKSYSTLKIDFVYKMENKEKKINETKAGSLIMKGDKYKLEISGRLIFCDGKSVTTYLKTENEATISDNQSDDDAVNPTKILNNYSKNFKPKYIKDATEGGKAVAIIDMTPIKAKSFYKIRLTIDKANKQIANSIVYDKNNSTFTYTVNKYTPNPPVDDSKFVFKKADFPGVNVEDLR